MGFQNCKWSQNTYFAEECRRIITDSYYIAHYEPICKELRLLKVTDMYRPTIWKLYFKLMNNLLPSYFNSMKPKLNNVMYIRLESLHLISL